MKDSDSTMETQLDCFTYIKETDSKDTNDFYECTKCIMPSKHLQWISTRLINWQLFTHSWQLVIYFILTHAVIIHIFFTTRLKEFITLTPSYERKSMLNLLYCNNMWGTLVFQYFLWKRQFQRKLHCADDSVYVKDELTAMPWM